MLRNRAGIAVPSGIGAGCAVWLVCTAVLLMPASPVAAQAELEGLEIKELSFDGLNRVPRESME